MKLDIARSTFLAAALSIFAVAAFAWYEPSPGIIHASKCPSDQADCPSSSTHRTSSNNQKADANLLLLVFGLKQAFKAEQ